MIPVFQCTNETRIGIRMVWECRIECACLVCERPPRAFRLDGVNRQARIRQPEKRGNWEAILGPGRLHLLRACTILGILRVHERVQFLADLTTLEPIIVKVSPSLKQLQKYHHETVRTRHNPYGHNTGQSGPQGHNTAQFGLRARFYPRSTPRRASLPGFCLN